MLNIRELFVILASFHAFSRVFMSFRVFAWFFEDCFRIFVILRGITRVFFEFSCISYEFSGFFVANFSEFRKFTPKIHENPRKFEKKSTKNHMKSQKFETNPREATRKHENS